MSQKFVSNLAPIPLECFKKGIATAAAALLLLKQTLSHSIVNRSLCRHWDKMIDDVIFMQIAEEVICKSATLNPWLNVAYVKILSSEVVPSPQNYLKPETYFNCTNIDH